MMSICKTAIIIFTLCCPFIYHPNHLVTVVTALFIPSTTVLNPSTISRIVITVERSLIKYLSLSFIRVSAERKRSEYVFHKLPLSISNILCKKISQCHADIKIRNKNCIDFFIYTKTG